jgi:hypothetical protein
LNVKALTTCGVILVTALVGFATTHPNGVAAAPPSNSVEAALCDSFVEFVGINAHANWVGTVWETRAQEWRAALGELGVRYVRTDIARVAAARDTLISLP